jgi:hypothetical protein
MTVIQFPTEPDQEECVAKLRIELRKLGTKMHTIEEFSLTADQEEEFLHRVFDENQEPISLLTWLQNSGVEVPAPDELDDRTLPTKLKEIIEGMASLGAYLVHTNHLSDRQLYEFLSDCLTEEVVLFPANPDYAYIIDLIGDVESGSDEDIQTYLKYYAAEKDRVKWGHDWPGDKIPRHEDPPFDRDRFLPQSPLG